MQLRETIAQDQEKSESSRTQIQELERSIQSIDSKITHTETTLKDLRKFQDQISLKNVARNTLFKLQQTQYAALAEENEGILTALCIVNIITPLAFCVYTCLCHTNDSLSIKYTIYEIHILFPCKR